MDFNEFTQECVAYLRTHPEQRWGQAVFNTLATVRPDLADMIRGTSYDPFHAPTGADIRPMWNVLRRAW